MSFQWAPVGLSVLCSGCFIGVATFVELNDGAGGVKMELEESGSEDIMRVFNQLKGKCVKFALKKGGGLTSLRYGDKPLTGCVGEENVKESKEFSENDREVIDELCKNDKGVEMHEFLKIKKTNHPIARYTMCLALARELEK